MSHATTAYNDYQNKLDVSGKYRDEQTLKDEIADALEHYKNFRNVGDSQPHFNYAVEAEEAEFDGMIEAMSDELNSVRTNLINLYERAKGTEYESMAKNAYDLILSDQQYAVCDCCGNILVPHRARKGWSFLVRELVRCDAELCCLIIIIHRHVGHVLASNFGIRFSIKILQRHHQQHMCVRIYCIYQNRKLLMLKCHRN